eukprot:COSAG02_NODE_14578_length_1258_cov_1.207075_1_plen_81_part_00
MRCVFDNEVLNVIERTRMQKKHEWGDADPEAAGSVQSSPTLGRDTSRISSPGLSNSGVSTPLLSPSDRALSTPRDKIGRA